MRPIKVALVGAGNCASALVQGLSYYRERQAPGLIHESLGGYRVRDIEIVCCFDVAAEKVGRDLADALVAPPNNTRLFAPPARTGLIVDKGPTFDGFGQSLMPGLRESEQPAVDVAARLRESGARILVSFLPVGSELASAHYAEQALKARCAFVNCMPAFIASHPEWARRFASAGLPVVGDDVKSQVGATIAHRALVQLIEDRGAKLLRTYQLNVGGNADFCNMLERSRLSSKKRSKTRAVTTLLADAPDPDDVHVGPSDFVPWLEDRKVAFIRIEAEAFGGAPLEIELRLSVWDSPNSAAVAIDAIRYAQIALDRGIGGALEGPSAVLMKSPPRAMRDDEATALAAAFAAGR